MSQYINKNILVTGGTGFIGSRLAERLSLEEKANVKVLVHSWSKATWVSRSNASLVQGDISNINDVEKIVAGNEIVFHCVGVGGSVEQCKKINVEGTKYILHACKKHGVKRIVYLSSIVVNGASIIDNMDETAPYQLTGNAYADSKIEAEKYFLSFIKENNIEGVVIRPTFVWGPVSPYYTVDIINQMKNKNFKLVDNGIGSCNAVHVDNVVDLCLLCGYHENANREVFSISDGEKIAWKNFWENYSNMLGMNIEQFLSVPSKDGIFRKSIFLFKKVLVWNRDRITDSINSIDNKSSIATRYLLKAPRKILKIIIRYIEKNNPEMNKIEIQSYSSKGFLSNEKSKKILNYNPRVTIEQGMKECEIWLKDQNFI